MSGSDKERQKFFQAVDAFKAVDVVRPGDRVMEYLFKSPTALDEAFQRFVSRMSVINTEAMSRLPHDPDRECLGTLPKGWMFPKPDRLGALVIADPLQGLGIVLSELGRPERQTTIEPD